MKKILVSLTLLTGVIGFVTYLSIIIISFLGCCIGIDTLVYHKIIIGLVSLSVIVLGVCMYNNCYKHLKNP